MCVSGRTCVCNGDVSNSGYNICTHITHSHRKLWLVLDGCSFDSVPHNVYDAMSKMQFHEPD